ncbi:MAG: fused MFS/spermidine synthase [Thermodesulfobacteriota bacterium]
MAFRRILATVTIGLSAFLLFCVEPMIAKFILPLYGGSSSVWLTALLFFQALLLAGYAGAHFLASRFPLRAQFFSYSGLIAASLAFLPLGVRMEFASLPPALSILALLAVAVGVPYLLLSTTSPMVQHFIAEDPRFGMSNPYVQYAVSNLGSFAGLLCYPLVLEGYLGNRSQALLWSAGFLAYSAFLITLTVLFYRGGTARFAEKGAEEESAAAASRRDRLRWVFYAFVPSASLLAFTQYLTVDLVSMPLLWVAPLALYLFSFVVCFLFPALNRDRTGRTLAVLFFLVLFVLLRRGELEIPYGLRMLAALVAFFAVCYYFHGTLEREKPAKRFLTTFYLYLAMGGFLGGLFCGIVAPVVFRSNFELLLCIYACLYVMVPLLLKPRHNGLSVFVRVALLLALVFSYITDDLGVYTHVIEKARSFYGTYTVQDMPEVPGRWISARLLKMGTTTHGGEVRLPDGRLIPLAYYHPQSGVGLAMMLRRAAEKVAVVGLGTGILSLYGRPGMTMDFYEIDDLVLKIAERDFSILRESKARIRHFIGDARIRLREAPDKSYDILVVDAFTSGAIPTHLLTAEALAEFASKVKDDGLILFHISNRFADLTPVVACDADRLGLSLALHSCGGDKRFHLYSALWAALSKSPQAIADLERETKGWTGYTGERVCWTDDYSHLLQVVRFF